MYDYFMTLSSLIVFYLMLYSLFALVPFTYLYSSDVEFIGMNVFSGQLYLYEYITLKPELHSCCSFYVISLSLPTSLMVFAVIDKPTSCVILLCSRFVNHSTKSYNPL